MASMRRAFAFLTLATFALAGSDLDILINAAASYSVTTNQQLQMLRSNPSVAVFAQKTIDYAVAKAAYFEALRAALPILTSAPAGQEERSPEIDKFAAALAVASEEQEKTVDNQTLALFARFQHDARTEKASLEFERAQKAEQSFRKEFDALGLGG
jgi:ABC-type proline/glycine betaine transport system permease subunit